jgi:hypothetical protein
LTSHISSLIALAHQRRNGNVFFHAKLHSHAADAAGILHASAGVEGAARKYAKYEYECYSYGVGDGVYCYARGRPGFPTVPRRRRRRTWSNG